MQWKQEEREGGVHTGGGVCCLRASWRLGRGPNAHIWLASSHPPSPHTTRRRRAAAAKPGVLDPKGRRKWEAWAGKKGLGKEEAMRLYVA